MVSDSPPLFPGTHLEYTSAVSTALNPAAMNASSKRNDVGSSAVHPNMFPPKTIGAISSPEFPSFRFPCAIVFSERVLLMITRVGCRRRRVRRYERRLENRCSRSYWLGRAAGHSESGEEKILGTGAPAMDGFGLYETGRADLGAVAHVEGIAVCEVGGEIAVIGDGNVWAFFAELDVVAIVVESMGEQTGCVFLAATDYGEQHRPPPHRSKNSRILQRRGGGGKRVGLWKNVHRFRGQRRFLASFWATRALTSFLMSVVGSGLSVGK